MAELLKNIQSYWDMRAGVFSDASMEERKTEPGERWENIFKNSLLIAILNLPWTILVIVFPIALGFLTFLTTTTLVYGSMLWMLLGFALVAYVESMIFRRVFAKYEPAQEEDAKDPDQYTVPEELPDSSKSDNA